MRRRGVLTGALLSAAATAPFATAAARAATRLVLSPADRAHLDMKYDEDTPLGTSWADPTDVRRAHDRDPAELVAGVPAGAVLGVEAPLGTETITSGADIECMASLRLPAPAERRRRATGRS
ncbi:hypothetical protein [Actinacidiphila glaucinigra]|uniref:hypothetical protein n=1 Tax=Actinacidiphila glaucinigra TaxID=235986 RepID=UPI00386E95C3